MSATVKYTDARTESIREDIQTLHDCQDIIEAKHREAMNAVQAKFFELTGSTPSLSFHDLELAFKSSLDQAMSETLDDLIGELVLDLEEIVQEEIVFFPRLIGEVA